jgi:TorA maturation chaperone TorD
VTGAQGATAARLLAAWWSRPTAGELQGWAGCWRAAYDAAAALGVSSAGVEALEAAVDAAEPGALLEEHERLLVGPGRVPCAPYESLWRVDAPKRERGVLMGAAATDAVRIYRALGLQVRGDAGELPDQLVVECEALAYALEVEAAELAAELAGEHLASWVPAFCAAVAAATTQPVYSALAPLTAEWATALAA